MDQTGNALIDWAENIPEPNGDGVWLVIVYSLAKEVLGEIVGLSKDRLSAFEYSNQLYFQLGKLHAIKVFYEELVDTES